MVIASGLMVAVFGSRRLGATQLWIDEADTWATSAVSWRALWHAVTDWDLNNLSYAVVARGWSLVFGTSETALRSLSLVCAVAGVVAIWWLARMIGGHRLAVVTAPLFATNALVVEHSIEARSYTFTVLLLIVVAILLVRLSIAKRGSWGLYTVVGMLAITSHSFAILVFGAHVVWLLARRDLKRRDVPLALALLATAAGLVGALVVIQHRGLPTELVQSRRGDVLLDSFGSGRLVVALSSVLVVLAAAGLFRRRGGWRTAISSPQGLVLLWLALPLAVAVAVSLVAPFESRYLIVVTPALALTVASALAQLRGRHLSLVATVVLLAVQLRVAQGRLRTNHGEDWRSASRYLSDRLGENDGLAFLVPYDRIGYRYARQRAGDETVGPESVSPAVERAVVWDGTYRLPSPEVLAARIANRTTVAVASLTEERSDLPDAVRALDDALAAAGLHEVDAVRFDRVDIRLYRA